MSNFLQPDRVITVKVGGETITIKQKLTPDGVRATKDIAAHVKRGDLVKPNRKVGGDGKPRGITVHNTNMITTASGTNPAEQYARATFPNGNMSGVVVHYWVWKSEIWQQLRDDEQGWHAADGASRRSSQRQGQQIGGNLDTIAIEIIQSTADEVSVGGFSNHVQAVSCAGFKSADDSQRCGFEPLRRRDCSCRCVYDYRGIVWLG